MKNTIRIVVALLSLLLPLATTALASEPNAGWAHQLRFNQTLVVADGVITQQPETPLEVLEQVADLFNSELGLAISDSAAIVVLCNQNFSLDDSEEQSDILENLSVGLKIRF